ncbi:MAG: hypothetical protein ACR2NU_15905 [Aeoliella sp.]
MQPDEVHVNDPVNLPTPFSETIGPGTIGGTDSSAYPEGDYYEQLHSAGGQGCGPGGACGPEWGCGGSPHRTGPGCDDQWRVGPRWRIVADGVFMSREDTNLTPLAAAIGTTLAAADQFENFDHGGGVRLLGTAYWPQCKGYEMVMGYLGIEEWNANVVRPVVSLPPIVGPPPLVGIDQRRTLNYRSSLHTLELNWQGTNDSAWKPYAGVRYFLLDEDIEDRTRSYPTLPLEIGESALAVASLNGVEVENNLIGFQLGIRRDLWQVSRKVYIQGFVNAGVYCNLINRSDVVETSTTSTDVLVDDPATIDVDETGQIQTVTNRTGNRVKTERTEASFAGEAAVTLVWKVNRCCALRSGYEVLILNGVELGDDAFLGNVQSRDLVFHGFFAGFEYRR